METMIGTYAIIIGGAAYAICGLNHWWNGNFWPGLLWMGYAMCNGVLIKMGAT